MDKLEFITKQLDKTRRKRFEALIVNRIWTKLDDLRVKFVTQQFVTRPTGHAMTDMYFPQLGIHIEVDEGHHKAQIEADKLRDADIVDATGHKILRIDATRDIEAIYSECDQITEQIRRVIDGDPNFSAWDLEAEMNPETYINKGSISVSDDAGFRTMAEAASCFGKNYRGLQRAYIRHPIEPNKRLWFPKFYENEVWDNKFIDNEERVRELCKVEDNNAYIESALAGNTDTRILFARVRGPLGDLLYRYKGEFVMDREQSNSENGIVYKRVAMESKTYPQQSKESIELAEDQTIDAQEIYESVVFEMESTERLKLAHLILQDIVCPKIVG